MTGVGGYGFLVNRVRVRKVQFEDRGLDRKELEDKLDMIDYVYDPAANQFV